MLKIKISNVYVKTGFAANTISFVPLETLPALNYNAYNTIYFRPLLLL